MTTPFSITFDNLHYKYRTKGHHEIEALKGVTIEDIKNGDFICIVGPNASGKSTFLDIVAGRKQIPKDVGSIRATISGETAPYSSIRKVYVPQNPADGLVFDLTIAENALLRNVIAQNKLNFTKTVTDETLKSVTNLCHKFNLPGILSRLDMSPESLSGGQQQLLNIISSILPEPHLIILDEPTSKLDEVNAILVWKLVHEATRTKNTAVICATHDITLAYRVATRVITFEDGVVTNNLPLHTNSSNIFVGDIRKVERLDTLPFDLKSTSNDWWAPKQPSIFGDAYYNGDNSVEGYLAGRQLTRDERTQREVSAAIRLLKIERAKNPRILDVPCGWGRHSLALSELGYDVTGCDINQDYIDKAKACITPAHSCLRFETGDMRNLNFLDSSFDYIINLWTSFGFFGPQVDKQVLKGFSKILRPGGRALIHMDHNPLRVCNGIFDEPPLRTLANGMRLNVKEWYCSEDNTIYGIWEIANENMSYKYKIRIYNKDEWSALAHDNGLVIDSFLGSLDKGADTLSIKSQEFVVILSKPS